ncbi:rhodanese-like domain protein [Mariniradius saccharolyticus AK6]|uniref:Rhodanese-like domain protein n=1 Tax=Mariniradius saccharolyticus AK6 TaxID=1239962 RepID=M7XK03_9BACT|nr:rhodanese-like domain-containing protein [Mariniradius saccharolyticus]EMS35189.1 rhodanese-like domain protein [Mariniradius saccharolyticus AK6]
MGKGLSVLAFLFFVSLTASAQSLAYKTMLSGLYDDDFPLAYLNQTELFSKAVWLDTREKEEYEVSHIKGAKWVGYDTFSLGSVKNIPKDQPIIVYCSVGARSQDIGKKLRKAGFKQVYNLYGGIFHWVNEGKPVYAGNRQTPKIHTYNAAWGIWVDKGEKVY